MNDIRYWTSAERTVAEGMKEIRREADTVRLLHQAGLANTGEHMAVAFGNTLVNLGGRLQRKFARSPQAYQTSGGKYAE